MLPRTPRLPGISVDIKPQAANTGLPRMDVAVFAGFAERGPCHKAIAINSTTDFAAIFGGDLSIGLDRERGVPQYANLPFSVRAFFANGGVRCWVIRLAWTTEQAKAWQDFDFAQCAVANNFALSGLLLRAPNDDQTSSIVTPALAQAASLGAWSDGLNIRTRLRYQPLTVNNPARLAHKNAAGKRRSVGLSFDLSDPLDIGDLIECPSVDGLTMRYAKVIRIENSKAWALWVASFKQLTTKLPEQLGAVSIAGDGQNYSAALIENRETYIRFTDPKMPKIYPNQWIKFVRQGEAIWLQARIISGNTVSGPAWQQIASRLRGDIGQAHKVTLDLMVEKDGDRQILNGLGLTPEAKNSLANLIDDDQFYASELAASGNNPSRLQIAHQRINQAVNARAMNVFGSDDFNVEHRISIRRAWLPIGLDASWSGAAAIVTDPRTPSQRDGIGSFDHRLFLDPRLSELGGNELASAITNLRAVDGTRFSGIHAALDIHGDVFNEASIFAVPDASIGSWDVDCPVEKIPIDLSGKTQAAPTSWRTHHGGCIDSNDDAPLDGPDTARFLDCRIRYLTVPTLFAPNATVTDTNFQLNWGPKAPDIIYILEESSDEKFATAVEIYRGQETALTIHSRPDGFYFYRIRSEQDGLSGGFSSPVLVNIRNTSTQYLTQDANSKARMLRVHLAMLRVSESTADLLAILSMPVCWVDAQAIDYALQLRSLAPGYGGPTQLGQNEGHSLSYGALYHPWLITGQDQYSIAPDGAIAGIMAATARDRGCWIAPANIPIKDVDGLDPNMQNAKLLPLDQAKVNIIRPIGNGLAAMAADTLSEAPEWGYVHVRRLMMLLRRAALKAGMLYAFEPNNAITRRAIERSISYLLDDLQKRGAFAGARSDQSYRLGYSTTANDRENGHVAFEIGVAPSQPLRFLLLQLAQQGARLTTIEKVAA